MECEICGKEVPEHNPIRAKIEGSVMVVCKECSKLGKIQKTPPKPKFRKQEKSKRPTTTRNRNYSRNDEPSEELIEDFSNNDSNFVNSDNFGFDEVPVLDENEELDGKYAAFAKITDGMDIIDKIIEDVKPDENGNIPISMRPVIKSISSHEAH